MHGLRATSVGDTAKIWYEALQLTCNNELIFSWLYFVDAVVAMEANSEFATVTSSRHYLSYLKLVQQ